MRTVKIRPESQNSVMQTIKQIYRNNSHPNRLIEIIHTRDGRRDGVPEGISGGGCRTPEPGEMLLWMQGNYMSCLLALFCTYWSYHPIHSKPAGRAPKRAVNQARIEPLRRLNAPRPSMSALRLPYPSRSEPKSVAHDSR